MDENVLLPDKAPTLRVVPMPADANQHGDIFGGWVMSQVDIAGGVLAARRARGRVATVALKSFVFKQPVLVGDVVSFYSEITHVGRTSVTVDVQVYAQRNPGKMICVKVTEACLTFVAVGPDRRPREVEFRSELPKSNVGKILRRELRDEAKRQAAQVA